MSNAQKEEGSEEYGLFNGRRDADQYVKGYLKGIAYIVVLTLTVIVPTSGWVASKILNHDSRIVAIESNRFSFDDGARLKEGVVENKIMITRFLAQMETINADLKEIKGLLRRTTPFEVRNR